MGMTDAIKAMMEADMDAALCDWTAELQLPGGVVSVTTSVPRRSHDADGRGFFDQADLTVVGKASDINAAGGVAVRNFVSVRQSGQNWKQYTIESLQEDALITMELQLVKSTAQEKTT